MNLLIRHVEYLLERRNCVVLPGLGALICATESARFDQRHVGVLLPPRRRVAFNGSITADDGILCASFRRGLGVTLEEARERVASAVDSLRQAVQLDGSASFGRLGFFRTTPEGTIAFSAAKNSPVNAAFAGLGGIDIDALKTGALPASGEQETKRASRPEGATAPLPAVTTTATTKQPTGETEAASRQGDSGKIRVSAWKRVRNGAAGVAASLAVLVTLTLFLLNPIRMANEPQKASIAPIPAATPSATVDNTDAKRPVRRLTIGLPDGNGYVEVAPAEIAERELLRKTFAASDPANGNNPSVANQSDRFCVIVASFPTIAQARSYIASSREEGLRILEKDGKCRVYSATAPTYEAADALRNTCGVADAWVCRR